jgi:hypothetical protein
VAPSSGAAVSSDGERGSSSFFLLCFLPFYSAAAFSLAFPFSLRFFPFVFFSFSPFLFSFFFKVFLFSFPSPRFSFLFFSVRPSLPSLSFVLSPSFSLFRVFLFPPFSLLLPYLLFIGRRGCGCCDEVIQPVVAAVELEEDGVGFLWQRKKEEEEKSAEIG